METRRKQWLAAGSAAILGLLICSYSLAASKAEVDSGVKQTLDQFYSLNAENKGLVDQAAGVLVFPRVTKVGAVVGGEHGEGALDVKGKTEGYYNITGGSIGATLGAGRRSLIVMFTDEDALNRFKASKGWQIGIDANVALISVGAGGQYDTNTLRKPVVGFVFDEKGLLGDVSLEGGKITRANPK